MNQKDLEDKARKEGLTVAEVRELTFFGFAAMRLTQPSTVQRALGRALTADESKQLGSILDEENQSFTTAMHEQVDQGATPQQRWAVIQSYEQYFMDRLEQSLGISADQVDQMLAPDQSGPTARNPLPAEVQPPDPEEPHEPAGPPPGVTTPPLAPAPARGAPPGAPAPPGSGP